MSGEHLDHADIVIVGAGPAGLSAAVRLRRRGLGRVVVLDREPSAGGIPRHCGHYPFGVREFGRLMKGPAYARRNVAYTRAAGVEVITGATVTALGEGPVLTLSMADGVRSISASRVLLSTGVRETSRAQRMIGGTKPAGVISTGALQGLVHLQSLRPFCRPVVLGTELVSFSALMTCRHLGIRPVAMIEPNGMTTARAPAGIFPRLLGIPLLLGTQIEEIRGRDRVEAVVVRRRSGSTQTIEADGVIVSGQFRPEAALLKNSHLRIDPGTGGPQVDQYGRCSDPNYFAAGNMLHPVETAGWCWREGQAVADAIADSLEGRIPLPEGALRLAIEPDPLKYVVPQVIVPGEGTAPLGRLQIRLSKPARGRLVLTAANGDTTMLDRVDNRPERRIIVPIKRLKAVDAGEARIAIEEGR
ncbi:NAD(P)/FAD-dependent oxidoreductase [Hoeflea prorocentri]|uniref:FAD/NAD(P)-binding oxidoreductase n=1 Tax=Hoeflea prorocentri TaxID=1922333 RepID=A0A9X3UJD0_9HYPH|nr:FAD/NAD(P)-binding oxidoreductase [Hoeflea prorocentri]MCY6381923.1 FAD/NAD(P)-binding oxidoreductase [Hoeflea prorocentri]MDA5399723.1 FAD/NAD(P)-binding oxidoreductase [Hoeflea prorocentri]